MDFIHSVLNSIQVVRVLLHLLGTLRIEQIRQSQSIVVPVGLKNRLMNIFDELVLLRSHLEEVVNSWEDFVIEEFRSEKLLSLRSHFIKQLLGVDSLKSEVGIGARLGGQLVDRGRRQDPLRNWAVHLVEDVKVLVLLVHYKRIIAIASNLKDLGLASLYDYPSMNSKSTGLAPKQNELLPLPDQVNEFFAARIQVEEEYARALQRLNNRLDNIESNQTQCGNMLMCLKSIHSERAHQVGEFVEQLKR